MDKDRNAISVTQTLGGGFGTGAALSDTGIFLNNMGSYFDEDSSSPNVIAPGKQVDFVVAPTQVYYKGQLVLSIGTPGGYGILHTTPQILNNILNYSMNKLLTLHKIKILKMSLRDTKSFVNKGYAFLRHARVGTCRN